MTLMLVGIALVLASGAQSAEAAGVVHGQVVPEAPRRDVPIVLDGKVLAHAKVGNRVFVGGDFQQVQLIDGTVITQPHLFAYDIDTGVLDPNFRPVVNRMVRALEPTQGGDGVYVGGLFSSWDGSFPLRIAKLDAQGNLDLGFGPRASARVQSIVEVGDSVYFGGDFNQVSGSPAIGLAKVDRITGAVDTNFLPNFANSINGSQIVRRVKAAPDGSALFVLHYASTIDGQTRQAVAKFDLGATPTLSGWNIPWVQQNLASNCWNRLRDMEISPDGSFVIVAGQGADNPPNCDSVLRYESAGAGTMNFTWSARMYSSVFSLAVSDVAIYVGGHFCAAPVNPIPLGGVSSSYPNTINKCDVNDPTSPSNPSVVDPANAVFRKQLAALNPANGQALAWNPGSNNYIAVYDLTLIDRGLLAGQDRNRFNGVDVGRSGLFDFGAGDDLTPPTIFVTHPIGGAVVSNPTTIAGTAMDNRTVVGVTIGLKNVTTNEWLQLDGSLGVAQIDLPITVLPIRLGEVGWSHPVANLPAGDYEVRGFATDAFGNTSIELVSPFVIPGTTSCSVALDGNEQPVISWSGFQANGMDNVFVRRSGRFLATVAADVETYTDAAAAPGDYSYLVRWRPGGVLTNVACSPASITVPQGGGDMTCTVGLDAQSKPLLNWTDVAGVKRYSVREAAQRFVAVAEGVTTYTDAAASPGYYSYSIRYRQNGATLNVSCEPSPITVPGGVGAWCTAAVDANGGVSLDWADIAGEDRYVVRDNDGFVQTVNIVSAYVDTNPTVGSRTYLIRYRMAGVTTDITCQPDPVVLP
ncbi:MAG: hypothetical protein ACI81L_001619 [Verrucomicrobiales bacterium]|jgi:hypothetical protein